MLLRNSGRSRPLLVSTKVYSLDRVPLCSPPTLSRMRKCRPVILPRSMPFLRDRPVITPPRRRTMALAATRGRLGLRCASCLGWQRARLPPVAQYRCCSTRPASGLLDVLIIQPKHARRRTSHLRRCDALRQASQRRHGFGPMVMGLITAAQTRQSRPGPVSPRRHAL